MLVIAKLPALQDLSDDRSNESEAWNLCFQVRLVGSGGAVGADVGAEGARAALPVREDERRARPARAAAAGGAQRQRRAESARKAGLVS